MKPAARPIAMAAGVAATIALLWLTTIPLGVKGEWAWTRILPGDHEGGSAELWLGVLQALIAAAAYLGFVAFVAARIEAAGRRTVGACLALLVVAGFAWLWAVQDSPTAPHGMHKAPLVLYAPSTSGYFFHARYKMGDAGEFLRGYHAWVAQGDVLHLGTHPPGLILFHHAINRLCQASSGLTRMLNATQPESVRESLDLISQFPLRGAPPITDADRASLWLAIVLTQLAAAMTVVPLYFLLRRTCPPETSFRGAALWPLVPALAIFLPKSDALYPFVGMLFVWCWVEACSRRSPALGAAAGGLLALALMLSLAFLPVAVLAALLAIVFKFAVPPSGGRALPRAPEAPEAARWDVSRSARPPEGGTTNFLKPVAAAFAGFAAALILFRLFAGVNLPVVWLENYHNHAAFYEQSTRTSWKWLLVNPIEFTLALGWPLALLAVTALIPRRGHRTEPAERERWLSALACAAVWGLLWLSGKNSGEAARLWLFLMPWAVWMGAARLATPRAWIVAATLQAVACIGTVLRVTGFVFG